MEEWMSASRVRVHKLLQRFEDSGCLMKKPGSGRPTKVTMEVRRVVDEQMRQDDETSAYQLHTILTSKGYQLSMWTILRCRTSLGWTFRGNVYCQLIRYVNKEKSLTWAQEYKDDSFDNVIFTDEFSVQIETHRQFCCRKEGEAPQPKPRFVCVFL